MHGNVILSVRWEKKPDAAPEIPTVSERWESNNLWQSVPKTEPRLNNKIMERLLESLDSSFKAVSVLWYKTEIYQKDHWELEMTAIKSIDSLFHNF